MAGKEYVEAPWGSVIVEADGGRVREVSLRGAARRDDARGRLAADLRRYFAGVAIDFSRYDVDWTGFTPFERAVLEATRAIPHGETRTYGEIAAAIGRPGAARAVGRALGKNRACIVVPCHRVVSTNGLGGFSGGIERKIALLELEGAL